ncbi:MAG: efflux RND transporter permease subunit [Pseudomonadota bacterium]|nr:efflux RND transporter permease subunit [Pseudomonadota bacterium]
MSYFTDIFIKRPVFATVLSLLVFILGLYAMFHMQIRQYPKMQSAVITVTTVYPGASAETVEGYVTSPLEQAIASADGVDYFSSSSTDGVSTITVYMRLNFDPYNAYTSVQSKVQEVEDRLPSGARLPAISQSSGSNVAMMYISYSSSEMSTSEITAYLADVVQPQLQTVDGVSEATILGGNAYAMRVWMDTDKMRAVGVTPEQVAQTLTRNNTQSSGGMTQGKYVQLNVSAETGASEVNDFKQMVIRSDADGGLVHLADVARIELGSSSYTSSVYYNDLPTVLIAINTTSTANPLDVIDRVQQRMPGLARQHPQALHSEVVYDATEYIRDSINEVVITIIEAALIVTLVIFLFLGSYRSVFIPMVTVPLSLVGIFFVMQLMGYSINLLTLLALVLAIGLVVDDAIVVLENTYRHIEKGISPFDAAIQGAREIAGPVISMTITLVAVYAPVGLMTGLTGALFTEFAFTLAGSVVVSGFIALTLSPMMCSKLLHEDIGKEKFVQFVNSRFIVLRTFYANSIYTILSHKGPILLFGGLTLVSNYFLFSFTPSELAPMEDQGIIFTMSSAPKYANLAYMEKYTSHFSSLYETLPAYRSSFVINGGASSASVNSAMSILLLTPWSQRSVSQTDVYRMLAKKIHFNPGLRIFPIQLSPLPTSTGGFPIEFVITSIDSYENLYDVTQTFLQKALATGKFIFLKNSLEYDESIVKYHANKNLAGEMGISMYDLASNFGLSLSGNYVNFFTMQGKSYYVIPELDFPFRHSPQALGKLSMRNTAGSMVPLDAFGTFKQVFTPNARTHFQQLPSATIQGVAIPGVVSTGEALATLEQVAKEVLPPKYGYDFGGDLRAFVNEGNALILIFILALVIIYLVLAGQFESFTDPLVILTSVPMATCGALLPLALGLGTINIYSQIGLITLIGVISKHGILMVEFAHKLLDSDRNLSRDEAIAEAAIIRLRPVLMTTAALVIGVIPLILATGPGAVSRFDIGLTIASGMTIGTLFTLYIVPVIYTLSTQHLFLFWSGSALVTFGLSLLI